MSSLSLNNPTRCAEAIVDRVSRDFRMAVPIGIGKPILLIDALIRLAEADRRVKLSIFTGLTLTRPRSRTHWSSALWRRCSTACFPLIPSHYVAALEQDGVPANIAVTEFFLQAGAWLASGAARRSHAGPRLTRSRTSRAYSRKRLCAARSQKPADDARLSLSADTDVTLDMLPYIGRAAVSASRCRRGRLHSDLPYMPGEAEIGRDQFE